MTKDHGFVASGFDRPRLRQRLGLHNISLDIPSGSGQAHTYRIGRKHLRMPVTDPHGGIERDAHVVQSEVKLAGVNPAMPIMTRLGTAIRVRSCTSQRSTQL